MIEVSYTREHVKEWFRSDLFQKGLNYFNNSRVYNLVYDSDLDRLDGTVVGSQPYAVRVEFDEEGYMDTYCNCPAYNVEDDCKHIVALLLELCEGEGAGKIISSAPSVGNSMKVTDPDWRRTNEIFTLFQVDRNLPSVDSSLLQTTASTESLEVEFICTVDKPIYEEASITLGMKLGVKRLYVAQKIKELLEHVWQRKPYFFTKLFTYEPVLHQFKPEDQEVIDQLIEIYRNEQSYREKLRFYSGGLRNDKHLYIPPTAWERLWPKLKQTNVKLNWNKQQFDRLEIVQEPLPIQYRLTKGLEDHFILNIDGLDEITTLENYGYLLHDGKLFQAKHWQLEKIAALQQHFYFTPFTELIIDNEQMNAFIHQVLPTLKQIGEVDYAPDVSERIQSPPLQAKIFVDHAEAQITVQPEFVYGETVIRPGLEQGMKMENQEVFLIRDMDREARIMWLLEDAGFLLHGEQIVITEEEEIFRFLYEVLPALNELAEVYVTPNVQRLMREIPRSPKVNMEMNSSTNLLEIKFDIEDIDEQEIAQLLRTVIEKKKYYRMADGSYLSLKEGAFEEISQLLDQLGVRKPDIAAGKPLQIPAVRALQMEDETRQISSIKIGKALRRFIDRLRHPEQLDFEIPKEMEGILRDYQKDGFQWFRTLHEYQFGGILADDMGLGKTLQSITYIWSEKLRADSSGKPALVIAPAALVYNWKNEFANFAPALKIAVVTGTKTERKEILAQIADYDVLITSYPLIRRDAALYSGLSFGILILDEAQAIKNASTQTAQAVKSLTSERRFALTGTPIENNLDELWSIYDAVFPELFAGKSAFSKLSPEQVARITKPFLLRRMKSDVLKELPEKIESVQTTELNKEQKKLYLAYLERIQRESMQQIESEGFQKSRMKILAGLTRLRQLCCHPATFIENYQGGSSKLDRLIELLQECRESGRRVLVFSQFTSMLSIIREVLDQEEMDYFYLDGQTSGEERVALADRFNGGEKQIFLISLKAGGTGLNLTGADTVILYDLWWNPAVEQQAADRAHRLGQKNVVHVIRLITQGTIEEKMFELQQKKKDLIDQVVQPGEAALSSLSEAEIRELLMLRS